MQRLLLIPLFLFRIATVGAQSPADTVRLTIPEAEKIFLQNNLSLLAAKYNIDANKALVSQARLWDNPMLITDQNVYDGKFFRHTASNGQVYIQVQQLILTAGKRNKLVKMAQDNVVLSQIQFDELLRTLQFTLRTDMLEAWRLIREKAENRSQLDQLTTLTTGMEEVYKAGNVSLKELLRLKALLFALQSEMNNLQAQLIPVEDEIRLLLNDKDDKFILPEPGDRLLNGYSFSLPQADTLVNQALANRPDVKAEQTNLLLQQHNLSYQKALAKPDITIGPEYDRLNSYQPNYIGLSVSMPLPVLNRNQGNIRAASINVKEQQTVVEQTGFSVSNEVRSVVAQVKNGQAMYNAARNQFTMEYDTMFNNMMKSYRDRQISLLDLTDFIDSYKTTRLQALEQQAALARLLAQLDYVTNSNVVPVD